MANFRQTLLSVAEDSFKAGEISRRDLFRLRLATLSTQVCSKLEDECCKQALAVGAILPSTPTNAIDWSQLIDFLKQILPVVIEFIKTLTSIFH